MSRKRIYSSIGINHIVIKGINNQILFLDDDCRNFFLDFLNSKLSNNFILIAYCLMSNHVHLLIKETNLAETSSLIQVILSIYSRWFNQKYNRTSSLFTPRFYNEKIESEKQLLNTIRYIHNNPVKANIVTHPFLYKWSSYSQYSSKKSIYVDNTFINQFGITTSDIISFEKLPTYDNENTDKLYFKSYDYIHDCIKEFFNSEQFYNIQNIENSKKKALVKYLVKEKKCAPYMLPRVMNLARSTIYNFLNDKSDTEGLTLDVQNANIGHGGSDPGCPECEHRTRRV